jgi:hypothetical protein
MRAFISLIVVGFVLFVASEARAQGGAPDDTEVAAESTPARIPIMVTQETALPVVQKPGTDASKKPVPSKKQGEKPVEKTAGPAQPGSPIVIPAAAVGQLTPISTGNPKYDQLIAESAARNGVDPNLIVAVMRQESGFNSRARSYKGATGLMQLMPGTAARFGVTNIYDPQQNIEGGARYLRFLLDMFEGDVSLTLAGYNAGENAVINHGYRIPRYRETQNYVRSISARYNGTGAARPVVIKNPMAPAAAAFGGDSSSRLSNNY